VAGTVAEAQQETARALAAGPIAEFKAGRIELTGATWRVTVGTSPVQAIWSEHVVPYNGAPCILGMSTPPGGQTTAWVLGVTQSAPLVGSTGKVLVATGGSQTITVEVNGVSQTATIVGAYAPVVNDTAYLEQRAGTLYAVGKLGAAIPIPPVPPTTDQTPPPPPIQTGTSDFRAQDSGTYTAAVGGWNSYYGQNVYSGSGYVPPSTGHWFYNGATRGLADKTNIGQVRFYLGARQRAGNYNAAATVHFYRHNNDSRGGNPGLTAGPHDISIPAGWGGGWVTLPQSFGVALKGGGGISIAGDPYVGFTAGSAQPNSGYLEIDWSM
jgi:hypothetical protein